MTTSDRAQTGRMPTPDAGLVRLLGVVALLPALEALTVVSPSHAAAATLGALAFVLHQDALGTHLPSGRWTTPAICAAMMACGLGGHLLTGQPWALVATAAALLAAVRLQPLPVAFAGVVACAVIAPALGNLADLTTTVAVVAGPGVVAALRHRLLVTITELDATRERLAAAAVDQERQRFSNDLHDVLGHSLSVVVVASQVVQRVAAHDPDGAREAGQQIETVARSALDDVRATMLKYRSRSLADEGVDMLQALATAGIDADFSLRGDLPPAADAVLALVLREAVTNVIRHSDGSQCTARLHYVSGRSVCLTVSDDGHGGPDAVTRAHIGLRTVRSRVRQARGTLAVEDLDPHGLGLRVTLPLQRPEEAT